MTWMKITIIIEEDEVSVISEVDGRFYDDASFACDENMELVSYLVQLLKTGMRICKKKKEVE